MYYNPTKLLFGRGQLAQLAKQMQNVGKTVLLVYGSGSIKRTGLYDEINHILKAADKQVVELAGVEPNPRLTTVERGVELCKSHDVDFVLAVGGGSVIDCTKAIVACAKMDVAAWDIITRKVRSTAGLPYGSIVTIAGTGAEMSLTSVITNWDTNDKRGFSSSFSRAQFTIVDPLLMTSVPKRQTIYGVVDTMSHVMEHYFHATEHTEIQDRMLEGVMCTLMDVTPRLLHNLEDAQLRETVAYASTIALSDQLSMGLLGDWGTHHIDHALSALYDIPHGAGMGILFPYWLEELLAAGKTERLLSFAKNVLHIDGRGLTDKEIAQKGIDALKAKWRDWGAPISLREFAIPSSGFEAVADLTLKTAPVCGNYFPLSKEQIMNILIAANQ